MATKPVAPIFDSPEPKRVVPMNAGGGSLPKPPKPVTPKSEPPPSIPPRPTTPIDLEKSEWLWHAVVAFVLLLLILIVYGNSFQSEWVLDNKYIIELDPRTKSTQWDDGGPKPGVRNIFTQDYWWPKGISGLFRPVTSFTYWLNWTYFHNGDHNTAREQVIGFHWINIGIHFVNAFLVYLLMLRLTRRFWVGFFTAAIFATHPIATESVTNIIGRADMFAATTVVGGLLLYMNAIRSSGWMKAMWLVLLLLGTALGVFSKESAGALVFVVMLYDVIYRLNERIKTINWREVILALSRGATIALMIFFTICVYLVVLVPWMGEMTDASVGYVYSPDIGAANIDRGTVRFDNTKLSAVTAMRISNATPDGKQLASQISNRLDPKTSAVGGKLKVFKSSDSSQWALYRVSGTVSSDPPVSQLALEYITGNGSFSGGDPLTVQFLDTHFPLTLFGTILGMVLIFISTAFLSLRKFWIVAVTAGAGTILLLSMGLAYSPRPETQPPGPGLILFRAHLADNPSAPAAVDAAQKARAANQPNPAIMQLRQVSLTGLVIFVAIFLGVEAGFKYLWPEEREDKLSLDKWKGFFDGYYAMLPVAVMLLQVRDWVFANTTPAEEPFLDNPLRGLGFIPARLTAAKVWGMLLWKLIWPWKLSCDYSFNQIPLFGYSGTTVLNDLTCILWALLLLSIAGGAVWLWLKGYKTICFFIGVYIINYLPTSNFLNIIGSIMAERFMYLPLIGFAGIFVIVVDMLARKLVGAMDQTPTLQLTPVFSSSSSPASSSTSPSPDHRTMLRGFYHYVPHFALALLTVLYGIRAFKRNYDWHTDVTLWTAAQKDSPRSFRSYQSLAFALFEQDQAGNIDRMINLDEQGLQLVDSLPNPRNSSRLYLHLGMYYSLKAELLSKVGPDGSVTVTDAARPWYEKSAEILERSVPIDRAFNEVNRDRDVHRGHKAEEVPDVGLAPVYGYLGMSYLRLGLFDAANRSFRYMLHLEPGDADSYFKIAMARLAQNQLQPAAVAILQAILIDVTRQDYWQALNQVFQRINPEPQPCIIILPGGKAQLDMSRRIVVECLLDAYRDFVRTFLLARRTNSADAAMRTAIQTYHFDKGLFDSLFTEHFPVPIPADPVFYHPPSVKFADLMPNVRATFTRELNGVRIDAVDEEIVDGRAVFKADFRDSEQLWHLRVSEEGNLVSKTPANAP